MTSERPDELLYCSDRTRVTRTRAADGTRIVRKQPLGTGAADRLRNEFEVLRRLASVAGVPELAGDCELGVLELVDSQGLTLADLPRPWAAGALLDLALGLATVLTDVHRCGVVHRDIGPANVLVDAVTGQPMLIDYELSTLPGAGPTDGIVGTLPYLAPEQSGRTGRPVDHRSDLYSLGATLYELATGEPPFGRDRDPLSLIHDHLARVPTPPAELNPQIPDRLSEIILRLLSKEPEQRYQSGEGLAHDLTRLRAGTLTELGERDFPIRLAAPARLIGREEPLAALHDLLATVHTGSALALITGPAGVGKTALVDQLRPAVAAAGGRWVTGKFEQFRHDNGGGAVQEAFESLGRQLLAEPPARVAELRDRLREALGADAGLVAALIPPFQQLLDVAPEPLENEPRAVLTRLRGAALTLLRTVTDGAPLVFFLDDLQWADGASFAFLDDVLDNPDLPDLLVLGTYREEEVDEAHPLTAVLVRLHRERGATGEVSLANLTVAQVSALIAEMLRIPEADDLAALLAERTAGNPFDTVELLNALRRDGALAAEGDGWRWEPDAVRDFVGHGDVLALLTARIEALPADTRAGVDLLACVGGEVPLELVDAPLGPAVDDGLVLVGQTSARFRHDRVLQAAFARLSVDERARLSMGLARRLAPAPEAAPLYLAAAGLLLVPGGARPGERRFAASSLCQAAASARMVANHLAAEEYLTAALRLLQPTDDGYDEIRIARHAALCALARFDDADQAFTDLTATIADPVHLARPVAEQVALLTTRRMLTEAMNLGRDTLTALGVDVPDGPAELGRRTSAGMATFHGWLAAGGDVDRPELTEPRLLRAADVLNRMVPAAFYSDQATMAWMVAQAAEIWTGHGVCAPLVGILGHIGLVTVAGSADFGAAYRATAHVLAVARQRGWEPETSHVTFLHTVAAMPWFEPLEDSVRLVHEARDGLLRGGDLRNAYYTYFASIPQILDLSVSLEPFYREALAGMAFAERIGDPHDSIVFRTAEMLTDALRGTGSVDDSLWEADGNNETLYAAAATMRALLAAVHGDDAALVRFSAVAVRHLPTMPGSYVNAPAHVLAALAAAVTARTATGTARDEALAMLDRSRDFLAARAAGCPANFRHLYRLAEATRAAVHGDFIAAATAYDQAMSAAETLGRSWHTPLITELAARFYLDNGLEHVGLRLLADALSGYSRWGATAKVDALKRAHPALAGLAPGPSAPDTGSASMKSMSLSTEVVDLMAVLEAARALSSETSIDRLRVRVQQVLGALTGATAVHMVLYDDRTGNWVLPADSDRPALTAQEAVDRGLLPLAAIRYAERTHEPLLIDDVSLDDRVNRDPYFAALEHCSLLVVPVIGHGRPRAVLILENRLSRRAFRTGRLDTVHMLVGQLVASLENAQIYDSLERAVTERTEELAQANQRLELLAVTDPLTGLPNRRRLTADLAERWRHSHDSWEPIGVAMIDIDHFKKYNDYYGHQGGDECLRRVAEALRAGVRSTDLVARYGGEEFCIVMPGATLAMATTVAERACQAVAGLAQPHLPADSGIVTVSVGVASGTPQTHADPDQLLKIADEALYQAKDGGRNRVVSHSAIAHQAADTGRG